MPGSERSEEAYQRRNRGRRKYQRLTSEKASNARQSKTKHRKRGISVSAWRKSGMALKQFASLLR